MDKGVIYYNKGTKCIVRMCVSLFSLRKHYNGPISVLYEGETQQWFLDYLKKINVDVVLMNIEESEKEMRPLVRKAHLWKYTPYEYSMFIDADTVVLGEVDSFFDNFQNTDFIVTNFAGWNTNGGTMANRIRAWGVICGTDAVKNALAYGGVHNWGGAVNTGIFGFKRNSAILEKWADVTRRGDALNVSQIPDELACQLLLPEYQHIMTSDIWNASVKFSKIDSNTRILHYHGRKHCGDRDSNYWWKKEFWDLVNSEYFDEHMMNSGGDRSFKQYLKSVNKMWKTVTFVTAVNDKYLDKLKENFKIWMTVEGLMEQKFIVFVNGISKNDSKLDFLRKKNVEIIEWHSTIQNIRERMLSIFVLGIKGVVKTPFFIKIDADAKPKKNRFKYDKWFEHDIVGHKWGYTRIKGDETKIHWLNTLDNWWKEKTGEEPIFPPNIPVNGRYGHKRVASYFMMMKTSFIEEIDGMCVAGKMIIPSQDTLVGYVAERMHKKVWRRNMKDMITA